MAQIIQMDETTYRIEDGFVRFFLLLGSERAALIDSGATTVNARLLAESITDLPLILINTHGDGDHTAGTASFEEIHIAKADYDNCKLKDKYPNVKLVELHDKEEISLGKRTLRVIMIPGHTKGSVALLDVEKRQLFAGDSVQSGTIFMFGDHRDPEVFEESLRRLLELDHLYDTVIASHDEPVLNKDQVEKVLRSWRAVRAGDVAYQVADVHGTLVREFQTPDCGFYCRR